MFITIICGILLRIRGGRASARASRPHARPYPCGIKPFSRSIGEKGYAPKG